MPSSNIIPSFSHSTYSTLSIQAHRLSTFVSLQLSLAEQMKCPVGAPHTVLDPHKDETANDKVNTVQEDSSHGTSSGALAGIAFGCTALLAVIVITTFLVSIAPSVRKKLKKNRTIFYSAIKC